LNRRDLIIDTRIQLPFWYSVSIIALIVRFFQNFKKKKAEKDEPEEEEPDPPKENAGDRKKELKAAALHFKAEILPPGYTMDGYLRQLENRWRKIMDKKDQTILVEDVKSLIRNRLRHILRLQAHRKVGPKSIVTLSEAIIAQSPALQQLDAQDSLRLYIQLSIIKLLEK
jgi:hypothetical protein